MTPHPWQIAESRFSPERMAAHESVFAVGNGYLGVRGTPEEGVPARTIAEAIARRLQLPVASIPADRAEEHFGWLGRFFAADLPASSDITQRTLGWTPTHPGLIDDLDAGHYG